MGIFGLFNKKKKETLDAGLEKTKQSVFSKITRAIAGKSKVDDDVLDNLEEALITSDVGVDTTLKIIRRIEERVARDKYVSTSELNTILKEEIASLLTENNTKDSSNWDLPSDHKPYVILVVGVNGVGKTTTIGKLAYQSSKQGKSISRCRRHLPRCSRRADTDLGRPRGGARHQAADGSRSRQRRFRYAAKRKSQRCRCRTH